MNGNIDQEKTETVYTPNTEKIEETATPAAPVSKTPATITISSPVKVDTGTVKGNIVGILAYLGGILVAILLLLLEKDNKFVRFHAMQSAATFVAIFVLSMVVLIIPFIGWVLSPLIWLTGFVLYIFLMYKAYQGDVFKIPILGDFVAQQIGI
jgi:uncharacterized membrane protein